MVSKPVMKLSTLSLKGWDPLLLCGGPFVGCFALLRAQDEISRIRKWKRNVNTLNRCGNITAITCFR